MNVTSAPHARVGAIKTPENAARCVTPDSCSSLSLPPWRVANGILQAAERVISATLCEPARTFTLAVASLAALRSTAAAPPFARLPASAPDVAGVSTSLRGAPWLQIGRQIGAEVTRCMQSRYIDGLDHRNTEAHCIGQVVFNRATGRKFRPDEFREMARATPDPGSGAGQYLLLVKRGLHDPVALPNPETVDRNIQDAARLALALPDVEYRIEDGARRIVEDCNLQERVDNDGLGQPGLFIRSDLADVVQDARCNDGVLVPPTELEIRYANAAQYFQSFTVKDEWAFRIAQHRIHEGKALDAADAAFQDAVMDAMQERIGL